MQLVFYVLLVRVDKKPKELHSCSCFIVDNLRWEAISHLTVTTLKPLTDKVKDNDELIDGLIWPRTAIYNPH